jgi:hypothetical protein
MARFITVKSINPASGMKTDVVVNVDKIIGVESDADSGNIIVDGGLCYRLDRTASREVQMLLGFGADLDNIGLTGGEEE